MPRTDVLGEELQRQRDVLQLAGGYAVWTRGGSESTHDAARRPQEVGMNEQLARDLEHAIATDPRTHELGIRSTHHRGADHR